MTISDHVTASNEDSSHDEAVNIAFDCPFRFVAHYSLFILIDASSIDDDPAIDARPESPQLLATDSDERRFDMQTDEQQKISLLLEIFISSDCSWV